MRIFTSVAIAATLLATALPVQAEIMKYSAKLNGASEVPANTTKGTGEIAATYDTATKTLSWKGTYSDLTGPETMAHFHGPAMPGANAGVAVPVDAKANSFSGSAKLTDAQAADLVAGKWYFNVHTDANKGGEIRGQLAKGM